MKTFPSFITLFSLLLFANTIESRKGISEYWRDVMKDQPIPEAIQALATSNANNPNCHSNDNNSQHKKLESHFAKDFDPRNNNVSIYNNDASKSKDDKKLFAKNFDPKPNLSVYHNDDDNDSFVVEEGNKSSFAKDFDSKPNMSVYRDNNIEGDKSSFAKDFDPKPNVSVYCDDDDSFMIEGDKSSFVKKVDCNNNDNNNDNNNNGVKKEGSFTDDFEPKPNVSVYNE